MTRRFKLGSTLLAAAALLVALSASQAQAQFTSNKTHTIYSGSQEGSHKFTAGAGVGSITCTTASFSGTGSTTNDPSLTLIPTWGGCKDSLGRTVDIVSNTQTQQYTVTGKNGEGTPTGKVHLTGELVTTVTGSTHCIITIKSQTTVGPVTYHNRGGTLGILYTKALQGIKSLISGGFFVCGTSATSSETGTYEGTTPITGKDTTGAAAAISVD